MVAIRNILEARKNEMMLHEYLDKKLKQAGFVGMNLENSPLGTRLNILALRPGLVIGSHGSNIRSLMEEISKEIGLKDVSINAFEVQNPAVDPKAIALKLANAYQKGANFRRVATVLMNEAMKAGALGIEIKLQGKIRSERASFQKFRMGIIPKSGYPREAYTKSAVEHVLLKMGMYGIKVTVAYKNPLLEDYKMKGEANEENKGEQAKQ
ncbi:MAG: 30S ribosomal protein S3 [Nitrososphaeria archaeon]|jgi:small subunit ribosomal protein S3